jgi:hypothetical protein
MASHHLKLLLDYIFFTPTDFTAVFCAWLSLQLLSAAPAIGLLFSWLAHSGDLSFQLILTQRSSRGNHRMMINAILRFYLMISNS